MGRLFRNAATVIVVGLIAVWTACSSSTVTTTVFPIPVSISLSPGNNISMELGTNQTFSGTVRNATNNVIPEPVAYQSSNTAVLTIAVNGLACAGTWDSLNFPQICTPGAIGVAQVTATAKGVSSPPTTVYVHQHIDSIVATPIPGQVPGYLPCLSKDLTFNFQANAFSRGADITFSVGPFSWQAQNSNVVGLNVVSPTNPINNLLPGQVQLTAKTPGITSIYASINGVNSLPLDITTCAVQSILLVVDGTNGGIFTVSRNTSKVITPTVIDSQGTTITGVPLTWCSSQPGSVSVGTNCGTNAALSVTASTPLAGGSTVIATCTPPNCNVGLTPTSLPPIYPMDVVRLIVTATGSTASSSVVYAASTGCSTAKGCVSIIIPITAPANTLGNAISLPATPNSFVFDPLGTTAYLGTDFSFSNSQGLMIVALSKSGAPVTVARSVTGKILTISPDGKKVIVSDTKSSPNQVFVFDTASSSAITLPITGATAAVFSPDALKAYIVAGSSLFVYSTLDPLHPTPLNISAPVNDVTFLADGAFAYVAGGSTTTGVTAFRTCDDGQAVSPNTSFTPSFIKSLADATGLIAVDAPNISLIGVDTTPVGCPPTVTNGPVASFPLGEGIFIPTQLILSPDGLRAYVLTDRVGSIIVFDIANQVASSIALTGSPLPLQASLSTDGSRLYVAANDGAVHVLDTLGGTDLVQITFPTNPTTLLGGLCTGVTFPLQSLLSITAVSRSASDTDTTYTYTVTSGPPLAVGGIVSIAGMGNAGNDGTFTIIDLGSGTFTVANPNGVSAAGQNGTGTVNLACNPDLIAVRP